MRVDGSLAPGWAGGLGRLLLDCVRVSVWSLVVLFGVFALTAWYFSSAPACSGALGAPCGVTALSFPGASACAVCQVVYGVAAVVTVATVLFWTPVVLLGVPVLLAFWAWVTCACEVLA